MSVLEVEIKTSAALISMRWNCCLFLFRFILSDTVNKMYKKSSLTIVFIFLNLCFGKVVLLLSAYIFFSEIKTVEFMCVELSRRQHHLDYRCSDLDSYFLCM